MLIATFLAGCGLQIPSDPDGTLDRVSGDVLRVGASPDAPLVREEGGEVSGPQAELVDEFAASIDASVEWTVGSEETLVDEARGRGPRPGRRRDDRRHPWFDRAGDQPRATPASTGSDGRALVWLVPLGENAFLSAIETFLDEEVGG